MSLRTRLTLWVLVLFITLQLITTGVFWLYQRSTLESMFHNQLQARAASIGAQVSDKLPALTDAQLADIVEREARYLPFAPLRALIVAQDRTSWTADHAVWPDEAYSLGATAIARDQPAFSALNVDWFDTEPGKHRDAQCAAIPINSGQFAVIVTTSDRFVHEQINLVSRVLLIAGAIGLIATAISGWYIAGLAIEPLNRARALANQLRPESLSIQIESEGRSSETKELTQALEAARERLSAAFAAQDRFISNVSHEIKTPIATLMIEAQTMDLSTMPRAAAQFVRTTEEEMRRLGRLVESFLTLTRIKDGKGITRLSRVPINELVLDSVAHCTPMARQYAVILKPWLEDADEHLDATIAGDVDLLRTMLDNLIRNAIRFSPPESSVEVVASVTDETFHVAVRDQGPGLPSAMLANAFDRFVQSADEMRKGRGHGLGLAIAQGVAELHNGAISVRNLPDGGAEFVASIPLAGPAPAPSPPTDRSNSFGDSQLNMSPPRTDSTRDATPPSRIISADAQRAKGATKA
jgi:signal transduction histidine kinase